MKIRGNTDIYTALFCIPTRIIINVSIGLLTADNAVTRPSSLQRSHPCRLSPTYTRFVFKGSRFELLRLSVRGTPSPSTHREELLLLLLRVSTLPCAPTTNNRGLVQHAVFDRFGLAQPHRCRSKAATCHANSTLQKWPPTTSNKLYRGRNCFTAHVAQATDMFSGNDCIFLVEQPWNECQLIVFFLFCACGVNMLPPRPSPLQRSHPRLSPTYTGSVLEGKFELPTWYRY